MRSLKESFCGRTSQKLIFPPKSFLLIYNFTGHFGRIQRNKSHQVMSSSLHVDRGSGGLQQEVRAKTETLMEAEDGWGKGEHFSYSQGPVSPPQTDLQFQWHGVESGNWAEWWKATSFVTYLFQCSLRFQSFLLSLPQWLPGTFTASVPPVPWSRPHPFPKSPELSSLCYFPALSSDIIFPIFICT